MKQAFQMVERFIWMLAGFICLWAAWDTHRRGGGVEWVFLLGIIGIGFCAYTAYHISQRGQDRP